VSLWASLGGNLGEITDDGSVGLKVEEGRGGRKSEGTEFSIGWSSSVEIFEGSV